MAYAARTGLEIGADIIKIEYNGKPKDRQWTGKRPRGSSAMKYHRLYADEEGESHFEEMEATYTPMDYAPPAPALDVSQPTDAARYVMVRFPAGWDSGLHPTPRRQLLVLFSG